MLVFFILYHFRDTIFKKDTYEDVTLSQEWFDREVSDDDDVFGYDIEHTPTDSYIEIQNADLVYNDLTLQALSLLKPTCEEYLFSNGYEDARTLNIIENSLSGDKSALSFDCSIAEYPNTILEVTYILNEKEYILKIK